MYINGHFCYAYKFGVVTNGLGIVRDISFFDRSFLDAHPEIVLEKKSGSPDEDKSLADSKALLPVLESYFDKHPSFKPEVFLGDAAFDSIAIYHALFDLFHFQKAFIPLNGRLRHCMPISFWQASRNCLLCLLPTASIRINTSEV